MASERSEGKFNMIHAIPLTSESRTSGQVGRYNKTFVRPVQNMSLMTWLGGRDGVVVWNTQKASSTSPAKPHLEEAGKAKNKVHDVRAEYQMIV